MKTDMDENARELAVHLALLRETLQPEDGTAADTALCTVEIKARMDGTPVVRGAA